MSNVITRGGRVMARAVVTTRYTMELAGNVTRRSAGGTLRATITVTDVDGATTLTCDSGGATWQAATG